LLPYIVTVVSCILRVSKLIITGGVLFSIPIYRLPIADSARSSPNQPTTSTSSTDSTPFKQTSRTTTKITMKLIDLPDILFFEIRKYFFHQKILEGMFESEFLLPNIHDERSWTRFLNSSAQLKDLKEETRYLHLHHTWSEKYLIDKSFRSLVERTVRRTHEQVSLRLRSFEQGTIGNFQAIHYLHLQFVPNVTSEMIQNVKILCLKRCSFGVGNISTFAEVVIFEEMYNDISFKKFLMENVSRLYLKKVEITNICELARYSLKSLFIRSMYRSWTNDEPHNKLNCHGLPYCKMDIDSSGLYILINPQFVKELIIDQNPFCLAPSNIVQFQNIEQLTVSWFAAVPSFHKLIPSYSQM
jgi:hypothetical protein